MGEEAISKFVPLCLETLENAGVMYHFRCIVVPREGRFEAANFDFVLLCLGTPESVWVISISAHFWAPEKALAETSQF